MNNIHPLVPARSKVPESEKVTINLGYVDLGHVDLLVAEGFYANRTDFIRTAIRNQLALQSEAVRQVVARKMLVLASPRTRMSSVSPAAWMASKSARLKRCKPSTSILRATTWRTASDWRASWLRMAVRMKSVRLA